MQRLIALAFLAVVAAAPQPTAPFRIIGNIYCLGGTDATSYAIATPKGLIVIDSQSAPETERSLAALGFDVKDVRAILCSHAHFDHVGGVAELARISGAKVMAGAGDVALLARGGRDDPQFGSRYSFAPVRVDRPLHDRDTIELGGVTLVARATPGHTAGCTTYTMKVRDRGRDYDVVFVGSPSVPSEYRLTPEIIAQYRAQFVTLKSLPCDVFLGSHGGFFHLAEKMKTHDFVDPDGYRRFVAAMDAAFEEKAK